MSVPVIGRVIPERVASRLDLLLRPREPPAIYERKLRPLAGVQWPRGAERIALPGEVPMFDVVERGELQEW
ncbi:hypothetical protein [Microbacterium sp. K24]|uniref:hypothetical protein n=1 Tax=Microbacterium sp. K24 TaxID=2305446 RepID=UPI00109D023B|nr:hypothetical protein [Microbacterium sp. K24]